MTDADTRQQEIRKAAERVRRLSQPGTVERFLTLSAVADETGFKITDVLDEVAKLAATDADTGRPA
jgi:hypothetical protein